MEHTSGLEEDMALPKGLLVCRAGVGRLLRQKVQDPKRDIDVE